MSHNQVYSHWSNRNNMRVLQLIQNCLIAAAIVVTLSACVGPTTIWKQEPYVLPNGVPSATLSNGLFPSLKKGDYVDVTTPLEDCATMKTTRTQKSELRVGLLYSMKGEEEINRSPIKIPASQPYYIQYIEGRTNGAHCIVHVVVNLEAGKDYTLVGGAATIKGAIPVLMDKGGCRLGVLDNSTQKLVPTTQDYCPKW